MDPLSPHNLKETNVVRVGPPLTNLFCSAHDRSDCSIILTDNSVLLPVLDDDDVELLDLIARTGGDLRHPRPLTGSSAKDPSSHDYSLAGKTLD